MRHKSRQLELVIRSWGGRRLGAGRKPGRGRRNVAHRRRVVHDPHCPVLVTLRAQSGLTSLRAEHLFGPVRTSLTSASRASFRVLHFTVQTDHLHLLVEADGHTSLRRGIQGLVIRTAKAVNRALGRRGRVWSDRYHARMLSTPSEVRRALVYVLQNFKKHFPGVKGLDPRSSAAWFSGWRGLLPAGTGTPPVVEGRTWLARVGWRRGGLLEIDEGPRTAARRSRLRGPSRYPRSATGSEPHESTTSR